VGKGAGFARGVGGCRVLAADAQPHLCRRLSRSGC
jgi:hypothetical protein